MGKRGSLSHPEPELSPTEKMLQALF